MLTGAMSEPDNPNPAAMIFVFPYIFIMVAAILLFCAERFLYRSINQFEG
jgi:hypothetical protein